MLRRACQLICFSIGLFFVSGVAQEGHPLTGTWAGDWAPSATQRTHLTVVMNWDGKKVSGVINPGPDAIPIGNVSLDPTNWTVRIEAERKDQSGKISRIQAEGKIEDVLSAHRKLEGTWSDGSSKGDFSLIRD